MSGLQVCYRSIDGSGAKSDTISETRALCIRWTDTLTAYLMKLRCAWLDWLQTSMLLLNIVIILFIVFLTVPNAEDPSWDPNQAGSWQTVKGTWKALVLFFTVKIILYHLTSHKKGIWLVKMATNFSFLLASAARVCGSQAKTRLNATGRGCGEQT